MNDLTLSGGTGFDDNAAPYRPGDEMARRDGVAATPVSADPRVQRRAGGDDDRPEAKRASAADDADHQSDEDDGDSQDDAPAKKSNKGKYIALAVVGVLLIVGLAVTIPWYLDSRHYETTDDAFVDAHAERVAPQVSGRVARVLVDDNERVEAGQVLVEIDDADLRVMVDQADAAVAQAEGQLAQSKAQKTVAEANVEKAKADVQVARTEAENAGADLKRYESLSEQAVSRQVLDNARSAARSAAANLTASQKKASASEAQVEFVGSQIQAAQASVKAAEARREQAQRQLSYASIRAMQAGRVTRKSVTPGDYANVGQQLMAIVPREVWVTANFKETQLADMRVGQSVDVEVDALPDQTFHGKVQSVQSGNRRAVQPASARERDGQLRQGRAARAGEDHLRRQDRRRLRATVAGYERRAEGQGPLNAPLSVCAKL